MTVDWTFVLETYNRLSVTGVGRSTRRQLVSKTEDLLASLFVRNEKTLAYGSVV